MFRSDDRVRAKATDGAAREAIEASRTGATFRPITTGPGFDHKSATGADRPDADDVITTNGELVWGSSMKTSDEVGVHAVLQGVVTDHCDIGRICRANAYERF